MWVMAELTVRAHPRVRPDHRGGDILTIGGAFLKLLWGAHTGAPLRWYK
jgi:hypothetical protein